MKQIIFAMYMLLVFCGFNAAAEASPSYMASVEASRHAAQAEKIQAARAPKLCLVWQQQFPDPSSPMGGKIPEGVTVVSPCWFEITSENGAIGNQKENDVTPEKAYIQKVHEAGCQAWPLLTNSFNAELTSKLLRNPEGQKKAIQNILGLCREYELDGINLDFENIADEDRDRLTHFAADISAALHKENKMVSIDVTAPSEMRFWSHCYDRKALSSYVDYVILMAYDEYSPFSEKAGSVASLPWVEKGIKPYLLKGFRRISLFWECLCICVSGRRAGMIFMRKHFACRQRKHSFLKRGSCRSGCRMRDNIISNTQRVESAIVYGRRMPVPWR